MTQAKAKTKPTTKRAKTATPARALVRPRRHVARYDAVQITTDNARHFAAADALSPDAALSAAVRERFRRFARYEVANNCYAAGMVETLADDCIGTGPRLQMQSENRSINRTVEREFSDWCEATGLAQTLHTMRMARACDGESFAVEINNPNHGHDVQLDLRAFEADMCAWPYSTLLNDDDNPEGIWLDQWGNPERYSILRRHPGALTALPYGDIADPYPASVVHHWFIPRRAGQHRGVPEIAPSIPLYAQLRRYTLAVIAAAETAADFAAVIRATGPGAEVDKLSAMDVVELEKRMATVLPEGWDVGQIKAEQPTTTYAMFKREILLEIARCLKVPYNVAAGDSSGYNYSSGRLDHKGYHKSILLDRKRIERKTLNRIARAWMREAVLIGMLPADAGITWRWFWDGFEHVDPQKEATAQATRLASMTTTLADEYAARGQDWEEALDQIAKERRRMAELGITPTAATVTDEGDDDEESEE